jgi:hypothetical protein
MRSWLATTGRSGRIGLGSFDHRLAAVRSGIRPVSRGEVRAEAGPALPSANSRVVMQEILKRHPKESTIIDP